MKIFKRSQDPDSNRNGIAPELRLGSTRPFSLRSSRTKTMKKLRKSNELKSYEKEMKIFKRSQDPDSNWNGIALQAIA